MEGTAPLVQFHVEDGELKAHFRASIPIKYMKFVTPGTVVPPQGLLVASSAGPLCEWLAPFITTDASRAPNG